MSSDETKLLFNRQLDANLVSVEQNNSIRTLHFNNGMLQSQIDMQSADSLPLRGNRLMLAHLMFGDIPQNILLAGCGGGAIARWFNAVLPDSHGLAVESSAGIISLARKFFDFPPAETNWDILQADIRDYLANDHTDRQRDFDFILFDIEQNGVTPDWLVQPGFLQSCSSHLSEHGVITFNTVARNSEDLSRALRPIRQAFPGRTYCLGNSSSQNVMITAFANMPDTERLSEKALSAKDRYGIEFDIFYQQLLLDNPPGSGIF